ncbi:hypothetical protein PHISP_04969 [Aspergillus sp. HF37]|nr:hypothetical protein PHISP_04969 [Aspergillus sp. HF37]
MEWNEEKKREVEVWLAHMKVRVPKRIQEYRSIEDFVAKIFSNGAGMPLDEPAFDQRLKKAQRTNQLESFTGTVQQIWKAAMQDSSSPEHVYREVFAHFKRLEEETAVGER